MDPRFLRYDWSFKVNPQFDKAGKFVSSEVNPLPSTARPEGAERHLIEQEERSWIGRWTGRPLLRAWQEKQRTKQIWQIVEQIKELVFAAQDYERTLAGSSPAQAGQKNPDAFLSRAKEIEETYANNLNPVSAPYSRTILAQAIRGFMAGRLDLAAEPQERIERLLKLYWEGDHLALLAARAVPRPPAPPVPASPLPPPPSPPSPVERVRGVLKTDKEILAAVLRGRREAFADLDAYLVDREAEGASAADLARERKHFTELIESRLRDIQREIAETSKPPAAPDKATP